eukprot:CAMPEP_0174824652 /NCGR_PEP_ID=MMETSP1107-20130205/36461_1 /TAXON_ID=36770 /ORGANISM="Paraphysomonas vestita, Strain GFlagA" /LENGTH=61 /DNA_ID=CAMNT_0016053089 /DNA_START=125 /DNA_END=307 /DNA_ORIENTATION=+
MQDQFIGEIAFELKQVSKNPEYEELIQWASNDATRADEIQAQIKEHENLLEVTRKKINYLR